MSGCSGWPALRLAGAHDAAARLPFVVNGARVGSVARQHLPRLRELGLQADAAQLELRTAPGALEATLARLNHTLRGDGVILAWRDEAFPLLDPASGARLGAMERAAARFWGTLTLGAHANGYVADVAGRPTHLWIAQRALTKPTDPGKHDNLIGGGVPDGQTPWQALVREGWEEAGLEPAQMQQAQPGSVLRLLRDIPEGLQHEWLHVFDLALPPAWQPHNQDGEVAGFDCLPLEQALALAAGGAMTVDAALATLDFALRREWLPAGRRPALRAGWQALRVAAAVQLR